MSSKLTHLAWSYETRKSEDKLLVLALAEISDNKGNFVTSVSELSEMTGIPSGAIRTILRNFISPQVVLIRLHQRNTNNEEFSGTLQLEANRNNYLSASRRLDLLAQEQNERLNQNKKNNKGKLNRSQRSQIAPLSKSSDEKQYSVLEIHLEEIPDWAEGLMFKKGVAGREDIWGSFVVDVHATGERIFTISQLINRLHQKIEFFKDQSFSRVQHRAASRPAKQSALSDFEEKYKDYLGDDD